MRQECDNDMGKFEAALSDAFRDDPDCGALGTFDDLSRRRMINELLDAAAEAQESALSEKSTRRQAARTWGIGIAAGFAVLLVAGVFWGTSTVRPSLTPTPISVKFKKAAPIYS